MNMNDEPQIAASAPSIRRWRRLTPPPNAPAAVGLPVYTEPPDPGRRSAAHSLHRALGLTDGELQRIVELLGREPNHFELAVFSLLWSEHCGYKHSALLLKRLPSTGNACLQGPGENAGVLDLGDGEAVCFKVESHNHPSAVEPFQGAATGVGGILRDIIAMGARPIALLDGLRFAPGDPRFDRAVAGIGAYGNSVGVPTVGGEAVFDEAYRDNVLVNAMCVGLLPADRIARAGATGPGQPRRPLRRDDRARRDRRRLGAREPGAGRGRRRQAPDRPGRRPVHGQEADRGLGRARRVRASSSRCRTAAPPASPPRSPRWRASAGSTSGSTTCRCARRGWSRGR